MVKILWNGLVSGWELIKETAPVWLPALAIVLSLLILWDGGSSCTG